MINLGELFQQPVLASGGLFAPGHPPGHVLVSPKADDRRAAYQVKKNIPHSATMILGDQSPVSPEQPDGVGDGHHSHNKFPDETPPPDAKFMEDTLPDDTESELPPGSPEHVEAPPPPAPEGSGATAVPKPGGESKRYLDENGKTIYQNGLYWKLLSLHMHIFSNSMNQLARMLGCHTNTID